jgi:mycothiol system anti-sigma-R factor
MSCGDPHETDCGEVLADVFVYLDGEMGTEARDRIRMHLDECSPCLRKFGIEREVRALVARCCGNETAPDALRAKVRARLQTVVAETTHVEFRAE